MVDLIRFPYKATMRAFDGSTFRVQWVIMDDDTHDLEFVTPFRSGRNDDFSPFDTGAIGEIPEYYPERSDIDVVPLSVCRDCSLGIRSYWEDGWPSDTPAVPIGPDGFATGCTNPVPPVISVGLAMPPEFVVTGSPVTDIGVLSADWVDVPAGYVLTGPLSGPDAPPTFKKNPLGNPWFYAVLTTGGLFTTTLKRTGIAAGTAGGNSLLAITNLSDYVQCAIGELVDGGGGGAPQGRIVALHDMSQEVELDTVIALPFSGNVSIGPLTYGFDQYSVLTTSGQLQLDTGGLSGDGTTNPACNIEYGEIVHGGQFVLMRFRGTYDGSPVYEFCRMPDPVPATQFGSPTQTSPLTINVDGNSGGNTTTWNFNANVVFQINNSITLVPFLVGAFINPVLVQGTGGTLDIQGTTTAAYSTIIHLSAAKGMLGVIGLANTGANQLRWRATFTDPINGVGFPAIVTLGPGGRQIFDLQQPTGIVPLAVPPLTDVLLEVQDNTPGAHTTFWVRSTSVPT